MKSKYRNYAILLFLTTSITLASCGDGDININVDDVIDDGICQVDNTDFEAEDSFSFEVQVGNSSKLRLEGVNSEITITGTSSANSVTITGIKRVGSDSTQDAQEHLQELEVNVQSLTNEVFVETIQPQDTGCRKYVVDYTITLPRNLKVQVKNFNGIVTIDSMDNDITVNNVNGNITLTEIVGSALVNLVNGIIESKVTLPLNGTIDLNTLNGDINLTIPVNTSAEFSAVVNIGSISVSDLVLQNEVSTSTSLSGTLGSGQGTISLESEEIGDISVSGF